MTDYSSTIKTFDAYGISQTSPGIPESQGLAILVHVGPHKTGTTWLQKQLLPNTDGLHFCHDIKKIYAAFLSARFGGFSLETVSAALGPVLDAARAKNQPVVFTFEGLGGRPFGQMSLREMTAHRIKAAFPQARILISIREQAAILNSMYGEYLRFGHTSRLKDFMNQNTGSPTIQPHLEIEYYDYAATLEFYQSIFGANSVMMTPMEWFTRHPEAFVQQLSQFVDAPLTLQADRMSRDRANPAYSPLARGVQRFLNQFHPADTRNRTKRGLRFAPNTIAKKLDDLVPKGTRKRGLDAQQNEVAAMVGTRFAASNAVLADKIGVDLRALGYVVAEVAG